MRNRPIGSSTKKIWFAPILAVLFVLLAPFAFGADGVTDATPGEGAKLQISKVDASDPASVKVQFTWNGEPEKLTSLTLRQNGNQVKTESPKTLAQIGVKRATVYVLDQSGSMVDHGGLSTSVTNIKRLVEASGDDELFGLVTFGSVSSVAQPLTANRQDLFKALDAIDPDPKAHTALWDGIASASSMLNKVTDRQHHIVVVTDGEDDSSKVTAAQARGDVIGNGKGKGSTVFAIGITQEKQLDKEGLGELVNAAGGRFFVVEKATNVGGAFDQVQSATINQYEIAFTPAEGSRGRDNLVLAIDGVTAKASFTLGSVQAGNASLAPQVAPGPTGPAFFRTTGGMVLGLLLAGIAIGLALYVALHLLSSRKSLLDAALSPYTEGFSALPEGEEADGSIMSSPLLQRAVAMTEGFAERQGFLDNVEHKLEMAEIPLKAAEIMLLWVASILFVGIIGFLLGGIVIAVVAIVVGILMGPAFLDMRARMRQRKFEQQLPDMLTLMAGALRAGFSLMQAVDAVSIEVQDPMGKELRRVVSESRLGRDLEDAMDDTAERTGSEDFAWAVMAIRIQREVGGNLAELLMTVAETMVQRERLRREVKALTAEGRVSAMVLALLPPALGVVMYILNPDYMKPLFSDILGQIMLGLGVVGMVVGYLWMRKIVQIDI